MAWAIMTLFKDNAKEAILVAGLISGAILFLQWRAPFWWSRDDLIILKYAMSHDYWQFFVSPTVWRDLTFANLTPWLPTSFRLDWNLFHFVPYYYHIHQTISVLTVLLLFYRLCRTWISPFAGLIAVFSMIMSKPFLHCLPLLMVRHYIEGLGFTLAAVSLFIHCVRSDQDATFPWYRLCALVGLYLLACSSKELFVPLPLVLLALPVGRLSERLRSVWPLLLVLLIYPFWRHWMLGTTIGGYHVALLPSHWKSIVPRILDLLGWNVGRILALALLLSWLLFRTGGMKQCFFIIVVVGSVIAPLLPVSDTLYPRYLLLLSLILGAAMGWCTHKLAEAFALPATTIGRAVHASKSGWHEHCENSPCLLSRIDPKPDRSFGKSAVEFIFPRRRIFPARVVFPILFAGIILGPLWWSNVHHGYPDYLQKLTRIKHEGLFVLSKGSSTDYILWPTGTHQFYEGLHWFRTHYLQLQDGPRVVFDPIVIFEHPNARLLYYDATTNRFRAAGKAAFDRQGFARTYRPDAPLSVALRYRYPHFQWHLGPAQRGRYAFLMGAYNIGVYPVPADGEMLGRFRRSTYIRIKYSSPEDWVTYSPPLLFEVKNDAGQLNWHRNRE